jgi:hypothetical protein
MISNSKFGMSHSQQVNNLPFFLPNDLIKRGNLSCFSTAGLDVTSIRFHPRDDTQMI